MTPEPTDTELNEAVAAKLGWKAPANPSSRWEKPDGNLGWRVYDFPWATSFDACERDLLPAVREKYPEARWTLIEQDDNETWVVEVYPVGEWGMMWAIAPTLARATCKVFLEVMKND